MAKASPRHTPEQVEDAVAKVRAFYEIGKRSLNERSGRAAYDDDGAGKGARAAGLNPDTLRAARRFADPGRGYTPEELDALFAEFRKFGFALGKTALVRLLSVHPRGRRKVLQGKALKGSWSNSRLESEIAKRFGTRRAGGRRRKVPTGLSDVLVQLEKMCTSWARWRDSLDLARGAAPELSLTGTLRERIDKVGKEVEGLHGLVERQLARENLGRMTRADALGPEPGQSPPKRRASNIEGF